MRIVHDLVSYEVFIISEKNDDTTIRLSLRGALYLTSLYKFDSSFTFISSFGIVLYRIYIKRVNKL